MKGSNRVCLLSARRRHAGVAKGGRILERRSGDPVTGWPARQKATRQRPVIWVRGQLEIGSGQSGKTRTRHGPERAFQGAGSVVVAHYAGITVAQMNDLRSKMRAAGGTVKVAKNRLAKIALQGTESESISNLFKGQTLIAYSEDPIAAPKVASDFAKGNDKLVILGGAMGTTTLNADGVKALATTSVARRAARQAGWHDRHAGNPDRPGRQCAGSSARRA